MSIRVMFEKDYLLKNDIAVNRLLSKIMLWMGMLIPIYGLLCAFKVLSVNMTEAFFSLFICFNILMLPQFLERRIKKTRLVKYSIVAAVSLAMASLGMIEGLNIKYLLILGVVISLFYFDMSLTVYAIVMNYAFLIGEVGVNAYLQGGEHWAETMLAAVLTDSLEMAFLAVPAILIAKYMGNIYVKYQQLAETSEKAAKSGAQADAAGEVQSADEADYYEESDEAAFEEKVISDVETAQLLELAYDILSENSELEDAVDRLIEEIGNRYNLEAIQILKGLSTEGMYRCEHEWISGDALFDGMQPILYTDIALKERAVYGTECICECSGMSENGGYIIYQGDALYCESEEQKKEQMQCLSKLSGIISAFMGRYYADIANRAKSDFLSSMSHEIRTPMNAISGFAELILQGDSLELIKRYAGNIKTSSTNLLGIINDILDFSKIEAGKFDIVPEEYQLHDIACEVRNIINMQLVGKTVKLVTKFDENMPDGLIGDSMRIRQILINTLNNSVKFTKEGEVGLELSFEKTETDDGMLSGILRGVVWDTGIGIKEEEIDKIFAAYEQADVKKNHGIRGTGLGLAITKQLTELMGGSIRVESVYGRGTKMIFTIPQGVHDEAAFDYANNMDDTGAYKSSVSFTAPFARALIVDDNDVNIEVAAGLIKPYGLNIETALSGRAAIDILSHDTDFDIIFMDHLMPDMDGIETTRAIREMGVPILEQVPIIALTANAIKGVEKEFERAGMNGYISKPIGIKELAHVLEQFIPENKKV